MPTTKQLFAQWEINHEFGKINDKGSEHNPINSHKCSFCEGLGYIRLTNKKETCNGCMGKGYVET